MKLSVHYIYHQLYILQYHILPTEYFYVFCVGSENKQAIFPYTALTDWFL